MSEGTNTISPATNYAAIRQALFDVIDDPDGPWLLYDSNEDLANAQRFDFVGEVIALLQERAAVSETILGTDIAELLRDIQSNAAIGEPNWDGIDSRIRAALKNAAPQGPSTPPRVEPARETVAGNPAGAAPIVTETASREGVGPSEMTLDELRQAEADISAELAKRHNPPDRAPHLHVDPHEASEYWRKP